MYIINNTFLDIMSNKNLSSFITHSGDKTRMPARLLLRPYSIVAGSGGLVYYHGSNDHTAVDEGI